MESLTLEQMSYIAEVIGVILIIISIIYLAMEIRLNTKMLRVSNSREFVQWNTELVEPLANQREICETWVKADSDFDSLDQVDKQRMILFEWRAISAWNNFYHLRQNNLVEDHLWKELTWIFENIGKRQSVRKSWKIFKDGYEQPFQDFMSQYLE